MPNLFIGKHMSKTFRTKLLFCILIVLIIFMTYININTGSVDVSLKDIVNILFTDDLVGTLEYNIIWKIRLPRLLGALLLGGALSVAGFLIQTFFKNPIAGPYVLGISSGSRLFVGLFLLATVEINLKLFSSPYSIFLAAFLGAMMSMAIVLLVSKKVENISMLLVIGMMIGYICSAITDFMITFAESNQVQNFTMWSMGNFSGISWGMLKAGSIIVIPTIIIVMLLNKPLNAYLLGENYAKSMGINIKAFRFSLIFLSSILSASVTAFAGPISFVGIACPHITKLLFGTSKPYILIPAIFLFGGIFTLFCDLIARTAFAPTELAISTVTAVFGAPVVIYLMIKRRKRI